MKNTQDMIGKIRNLASDIYKKIMAKKKPELKMPLRSLANVNYDIKKGYFELSGQFKERTLTVNTIKTFAQTLRMLGLSKQLVETDDIATKREAYYVSKNWGDARFLEQPESVCPDEPLITRVDGVLGIWTGKELV